MWPVLEAISASSESSSVQKLIISVSMPWQRRLTIVILNIVSVLFREAER
jgi:hypothetical protein